MNVSAEIVKVARVVNLKLAFTEWFFLVILIKLYKIRYLNLDKALLFPINHLSEKLKTLTSSNYHKVQYFMLRFYTRFLLKNVYKWMLCIFFILFRSWVINNNVKKECVETRSFFIFANISRSKQNKKNPEHPFVDIGK